MEGVWQENLLQCPAACRGGRGARLLLPGALGAERGWLRAGRRAQGRAALLRAPKAGPACTQLLLSSSSHGHPQRQAGYFPEAGANIAVPEVQKLLRCWGRWSSEGLAFLFFNLLLRVRFAFTSLFYVALRNGIRQASLVSLLLQPNQITPSLLGTSCSIGVQLPTVPALRRVGEAY